MRAKLTAGNRMILPKAAIAAVDAADYFGVTVPSPGRGWVNDAAVPLRRRRKRKGVDTIVMDKSCPAHLY